MSIKRFLDQLWRLAVLALGFVALGILVRALLPMAAVLTDAPPANPGKTFLSLFFVYGLYALAMQYVALKARVGGWRLFFALACLAAGFGSFMLQIETLFFGEAFPQLSSMDTLNIMLNRAVAGLAFSALVVTVMGKWRTVPGESGVERLGAAFASSWKAVIVGAVVYPIIYFIFGYFVAYGSRAAVDFYAATAITKSSLILVGFQVFRGALWVLLAVPVANVLAKREELLVALAVGMPLFSGLALIFENPVMPEAVRYAHGFELTSSMTLFGIVAALALAGSAAGRATADR